MLLYINQVKSSYILIEPRQTSDYWIATVDRYFTGTYIAPHRLCRTPNWACLSGMRMVQVWRPSVVQLAKKETWDTTCSTMITGFSFSATCWKYLKGEGWVAKTEICLCFLMADRTRPHSFFSTALHGDQTYTVSMTTGIKAFTYCSTCSLFPLQVQNRMWWQIHRPVWNVCHSSSLSLHSCSLL